MPGLQAGGHLERLAALGALHAAGTDAGYANALRLDRAADLDLDALQVGLEGPLGNARRLAADAAQVLGLAAAGVLVADDRLLPANVALHAHDDALPRCSLVERVYYSGNASADKARRAA